MDDFCFRLTERARAGGRIRRHDLAELASRLAPHLDAHGRITPALQRSLSTLERRTAHAFSPGATAVFQSALGRIGGRLRAPIVLPEESQPFWLLGHHPLAGYQSARQLPRRADVVVIGSGLTGTSTALHLADAVAAGLRVVVLEMADPGTQASGRNGGNFELIPENFLGEYEGLPTERRKWLARRYPWLPESVLKAQADRQARLIFEFGARNSARFLEIVRTERIDCDVSEGGWLRIAETAGEERGILDEIRFAATCGVPFEAWPAGRIRRELAIPARRLGRWARRNGNYHPFKFVCGALARALERGVQLFARTPVTRLRPGRHDTVEVETSRGRIEARRVVFATNAFTSRLLPELSAIQYYQSQILNLEHVRNTIRGMTVTEKKGDLYYNFPKSGQYVDPSGTKRGLLLVGGGLDRPGADPTRLRRSAAVLDLVKGQTDERFPETRGQPPSRVWTGPMAFTPDRLPAIGFLRRRGWAGNALIVAAGFNGYGGTYCVETGRLAAQMAVTGETPDEIPEEVLSPHRFLTRRPLFAAGAES